MALVISCGRSHLTSVGDGWPGHGLEGSRNKEAAVAGNWVSRKCVCAARDGRASVRPGALRRSAHKQLKLRRDSSPSGVSNVVNLLWRTSRCSGRFNVQSAIGS